MTEIYKTVTYLVLSFLLCLGAHKIGSSFINDFSDNFIALLTTLLAINIASSSLIAGKLKEINIATGQSFEKTRSELKRSLTIQLFLIAITFIILILKSSTKIEILIGVDNAELISNTITVGVFIYYLDTIKDLGQALFSLLDFGDNNTNTGGNNKHVKKREDE